jgi:hypothetical protein
MIDLEKLTQEQQWGLAFSCKKINDAKAEGEKDATPQEYAEKVLRGACDSYYQQLLQFKTQMALAGFAAMTPEQQTALVQQLGIPDVL